MPITDGLKRELERIQTESIFEKPVFFLRNLGFVARTEARRISYEDALRFERIHEDTYRHFGFEIVWIEPGMPQERSAAIRANLHSATREM